MKFDKQKAFPYPVLRPSSDDYIDCEFQSTVDIRSDEGSQEVVIEVSYAISADEIMDEIKKGYAEYVSVVSCRETYFQHIIASSEEKQEVRFDIGLIRGEVLVEPYVVVKREIDALSSPDINPEFGPGPFRFSVGDVLAQDEAQVVFIGRDLFKPVTSVFELVKKDALTDAEWTIGYDQEHIQIEVSPEMKEKIDNARNETKNRAILINSLYFAAVMQAIQKLKESDGSGEYEEYMWAKVIRGQAHNKGHDIDSHDAYLLAQRLMQYPLNLLDVHIFKGGD